VCAHEIGGQRGIRMALWQIIEAELDCRIA
jgi:hypothetical protein